MYKMQHFIIFAQIRTGYQYLTNMLLRHPQICMLGEIFVHLDQVRKSSLFGADIPPYEMGQDPVWYIRDVVDPYALRQGCQIVGFKQNYHPPMTEQEWSYLAGWKIIHLTRRNLLDRLLSEKLAIQENRWNFGDYQSTVEITAEELQLYSEASVSSQQVVLDHCSPYSVVYEDLVANPSRFMSGVQGYLGVDILSLPSTLPRQRRGPQSQYISNYEGLSRELQGTDYMRFLTG